MTASLWREASTWPFRRVRPRVRARVPAGVLDTAIQQRLVTSEPLDDGAAWPCGCCGGRARLRREVDGLVAACEDDPAGCPVEPVVDVDAEMIALDVAGVAAVVQRALGMPTHAPPLDRWRRDRVVLVGDLQLGHERTRVVATDDPRSVADRWVAATLREDPVRVLVVLVPHQGVLAPGLPRRIEGAHVAWLALDEVLTLDGAPTLDLSSVLLATRPRGLDLGTALWPRFDLVLDPAAGRFHHRGRLLALDRSPLAAKLLVTLATHAGTFVSRRELMLALWPEDFSARTREPVDPFKLDRRLRQLLSDTLAPALRDAGTTAATEPIENLRTRGDTDGGWRLSVPPDRICFLSDPS